jgi:S1-C subfamily serine protease
VRLNGAVPNPGSHLVNAKLIGIDRQTDLAVIKIDLTGLPFLTFADSDGLNQGQTCSLLAVLWDSRIPTAWEWSVRWIDN